MQADRLDRLSGRLLAHHLPRGHVPQDAGGGGGGLRGRQPPLLPGILGHRGGLHLPALRPRPASADLRLRLGLLARGAAHPCLELQRLNGSLCAKLAVCAQVYQQDMSYRYRSLPRVVSWTLTYTLVVHLCG